MRLLLDTNIMIGLSKGTLAARAPGIARAVDGGEHHLVVSVASLWEIAIKARLGKLDPGARLDQLASFFEAMGTVTLPITRHHATAEVNPVPPTRDPFDRLLLAQCAVEGLALVTLDRALRDHPLAARLG